MSRTSELSSQAVGSASTLTIARMNEAPGELLDESEVIGILERKALGYDGAGVVEANERTEGLMDVPETLGVDGQLYLNVDVFECVLVEQIVRLGGLRLHRQRDGEPPQLLAEGSASTPECALRVVCLQGRCMQAL